MHQERVQCPQCTRPGKDFYKWNCPRCNGTGRLKNTCPTCHGDGRVSTTETVDVRIPPGAQKNMKQRIQTFQQCRIDRGLRRQTRRQTVA